jgi:8-oxo-dGTP diphosphatase
MLLSTAAIIRQGRKFFLARRKPTGSMASRWEFPGGKVEGEETPEQGLKRELEEEFGIHADIGSLLFTTCFRNNDIEYRLISFEATIGEPPVFLAEHTEIGWFTLEEIERLDLADSDRVLFQKLKPYFILRFQAECSRSLE